MADKDDLLAELIFKKHQERALDRQKKIEVTPQIKMCSGCEFPEQHCICKTSVVHSISKAVNLKDLENLSKKYPEIKLLKEAVEKHPLSEIAADGR